MSNLRRLARRLHLAKPASPSQTGRRISLDYVEYLESVASPELAAFTRKAYEQDLARDARQRRGEASQAVQKSGDRP